MSFLDPQHHVNLEQQRKRAKDLRRSHHEGQIEAAVRVIRHLPRARNQSPEEVLRSGFTLSEAQFVIAREAGFSSWPSMKHQIERTALNEGDVDELTIVERDPAAAHRSIYVAAAAANAEAALALLDNDPSLADQRGGSRHWTPLLYLCYSRYGHDDPDHAAARLRIARRLIELGADVNARGKESGYVSFNVNLFDQEEWHPIEAAAGQLADPELVRVLLDAGADPRRASIVLSQAVRGGSRKALGLLLLAPHHEWQIVWALKACAVLNKKDMAEELAPYIAPPRATNGPAVIEAIRLERDRELIDILLGKGNSEELHRVWRKVFRVAMRYRNHAAVELLRRRGADETAVTDVDRMIGGCLDGDPHPRFARPLPEGEARMLAWAVRTGREHAVPLLIKAGLDANVPDLDGETPLTLAARGNAIEVVDTLLRAGAAVDARNFEGETPLDVAVAHHHEDVIKRLLAAGAQPKREGTELEREEMNVLFERAADAVATGDLETLRELLDDEPALIHARSPRRHRATLLNYCGANGVEDFRQRTPANAPDITRLLLDRGADVNATCNLYGGGATTLGLLLTSIYPQRAGLRTLLMEILVRAGAMKGIVGAAALGRLDVVKKEADTSKSELESALLWACEYARASVVEFLLQRGVDVEVQGENRMTPIHLAALSGSLETVQLLIERGASLEVRNTWGGTVLNSALYGAMNWDPNVDYVPVVEALLKHGAEVRPGFPEWWAQQETLIPSAKDRIAELLNRHRKADA